MTLRSFLQTPGLHEDSLEPLLSVRPTLNLKGINTFRLAPLKDHSYGRKFHERGEIDTETLVWTTFRGPEERGAEGSLWQWGEMRWVLLGRDE